MARTLIEKSDFLIFFDNDVDDDIDDDDIDNGVDDVVGGLRGGFRIQYFDLPFHIDTGIHWRISNPRTSIKRKTIL